MDPSRAGDLRGDRARLQGRRNDPLLLRSRRSIWLDIDDIGGDAKNDMLKFQRLI
jgi:hypothetical protein